MSRPLEERVLVLLSSAADAELSRTWLEQAGVPSEDCADLGHLCHALREGAAVVLLAEEWLSSPDLDCLVTIVERQPAWSELPILVLARGDDGPDTIERVQRLGNVTWIERPLRAPILLTAVQSALRSRRRQYQLREQFRNQEEIGTALRESEERLRFSLEAGRLGFWEHDLTTGALICSETCRAQFGRLPAQPLSHDEVVATVHPEDRDRIREMIHWAILTGESYVLEYRVIWPDGSLHWLMVRGCASYNHAGKAVRTFGVTLDITERRETELRLRDAARRKDEFLAMLAHELRNPLAPMMNALAIMRSRPGRKPGERARVVLERQLRHLSRLVDDLLDVSRINTGKITLKRERLDLVAAVERAMESVRSFVTECGHILDSDLPADPVFVDADPVRLEQVITNLLNNAAKYTEPGGRICVALDTANSSARIRVSDTGIGIPPDLLTQVFDLFTQGERTLDRSQGGLGLGLTLVRSLVRLHGGTVEAFSEGPGRGSEFVVTLPILDFGCPLGVRILDSPDEDHSANACGQSIAADIVTAPTRQSTSPIASASGQSIATDNPKSEIQNPKSRRLLVVDDNQDSAETLADLARIWGFEVDTAYDGLAALRKADEWQPAWVFLDIGMPGLDGYEVARRLRADRRFENTKLVALTGYGQEGDRARSRAAGFDHHLVKPVDLAELEQLLRGVTDPQV